MGSQPRKRAMVLIDGEHHPTVVKDAVDRFSSDFDVVAAAFLGGEEKVPEAVFSDPVAHFGCPVVRGDGPADALRKVLAESEVDVVIDLADEPIADPAVKVMLASLALAAGAEYRAPDMSATPLKLSEAAFDGPKIAVIGTAKRTGKTAVCGHLAGLIDANGGSPAVVSMGRGGPPEPQTAMPPITIEDLLAIAESGVHAASDYLEDAALAGVPTVGCRRVGGGFSGAVQFTNFERGVEVAAAIDGVDTLLFEGSGATVPPVRADKTVVVVGDLAQATSLTGPARVAIADLVLVRDEDPQALAAVKAVSDAPAYGFSMLSVAQQPIPDGAVAAVFTTGATHVEGVEAAVSSTNLARREMLHDDVKRAIDAGCDHFLVEVKAAGIDTVARAAREAGAAVTLIGNRPVSDDTDLDELLLNVWRGRLDE